MCGCVHVRDDISLFTPHLTSSFRTQEHTHLQCPTHSRSRDIWIDVHVVCRWFQPYNWLYNLCMTHDRLISSCRIRNYRVFNACWIKSRSKTNRVAFDEDVFDSQCGLFVVGASRQSRTTVFTMDNMRRHRQINQDERICNGWHGPTNQVDNIYTSFDKPSQQSAFIIGDMGWQTGTIIPTKVDKNGRASVFVLRVGK